MDVARTAEEALELAAAGRGDAAETLCRQILRINPEQTDALYVMGIVEHGRGRHGEAERWLRRAIARDGSAFWIHVALGEVLLAMGEPERAVEAYAAAAQLNPDSIEACSPLATLLMKLKRWPEAVDALRRLVKLSPNDAKAHAMLVDALRTADRFDPNAIDAIERALLLDPSSNPTTRAHYADALLAIGDLRRAIDQWRSILAEDRDAANAHEQLLMALNYDPAASVREVFEEHARWSARHADPLTGVAPMPLNSRDPDRPLRVGYISPDFRLHPVAHFVRRIFECHDRQLFLPTCYDDVAEPDALTHDLQRLSCAWTKTLGWTDEQVLERIQADGIEVLIDLAGHTGGNRLGAFARRVAPVQISYVGYCNTTGMRAMDYVVGDDITDPPGATQPYVEQVIRLPGGFCCYAPKEHSDEPNELPALRTGFITFGSFHGPAKLNDGVLALWSRLLREVPGSRLLFWRHLLKGRARELLHSRVKSHGIEEDRFEIRSDRPGESHLNVYHFVDIALDTQPWSGHTTSCHSMWMGVPFVTMLGNTHAGRMAASTVVHAGFGEFVARDSDGYIEIARRLAADRPRLAELRRTMRATMAGSPLCDGWAFTTQWEQALRCAWQTWCDRADGTKS